MFLHSLFFIEIIEDPNCHFEVSQFNFRLIQAYLKSILPIFELFGRYA